MNIFSRFFKFLDKLALREVNKKKVEEFVRLQQRNAVILRLKKEIKKNK